MQPIRATITTLNRLSEIISSINTQVITHLFIWTSYRQVKQKMALYKEFQSIHFMIKTDSSYTHKKMQPDLGGLSPSPSEGEEALPTHPAGAQSRQVVVV
jgi:hypothetical protein